MKNLSLLSVITLFLLASCDPAQENYLKNATDFLKAEDYRKAKEQIDMASESEGLSDSAHTWYYKGYIYYELYKSNKDSNGAERSSSIDYFVKSLEIDESGKYAEGSRATIVNIASTYYNDAVYAIGDKDPEKGQASFDIFLENIVLGDSDLDLKQKQIDVNLAIGSIYVNRCETDPTDTTCLQQSVAYFDKVLALDSNNLNANYNMGILYYNKAVRKIAVTEACKQIDVALAFAWGSDSQIPSLEEILGCLKLADFKKYGIEELFRSALPYLEKAMELEPENPNTKIGLDGINFILENCKAA